MSVIKEVIRDKSKNDNGTFKFNAFDKRPFNENDTFSVKYTKMVDNVLTRFVEIFLLQLARTENLLKVLKTKIDFVVEHEKAIASEKIEIERIQNYLKSLKVSDIPVLPVVETNDSINLSSSKYSDDHIIDVFRYCIDNKIEFIKEVSFNYMESQNLGTFNRDTHRVSKIPSKKELVTV